METQGVRQADATQYFTYQHPEDYYPDWPGYYQHALNERQGVQARFKHHLGIKYGSDPYQLANVYLPGGTPSADAPFILYFHGGRFREGHPDFYDALAMPWVQDGAVFASCGYRLEPEYGVTDAVDDCVAAIQWAHDHAKAFGADPERLVVAGHSAGGYIAAMSTLTDWRGSGTSVTEFVTVTVCMSAPVEVENRQEEATRLNPANRIIQSPSRVVVSYGDPEPNKKSSSDIYLTEQGRVLVDALRNFGAPVREVTLKNVDHIGSAMAFSDRESQLFDEAHRAIFAEDA
jgi:arylformamidase